MAGIRGEERNKGDNAKAAWLATYRALEHQRALFLLPIASGLRSEEQGSRTGSVVYRLPTGPEVKLL